MQDPRRIDPALLERYDVRGPRYTSYPPATHFHPIPVSDVSACWSRGNTPGSDTGLSLYLHIPFCRSRCLFCGCHAVVGADGPETAQYIDAVVQEMRLSRRWVVSGRPVFQVAIGGGTPNFPDTGQIDRLLSAVRLQWAVQPGAEMSVELDPRAATAEKLSVFLDHGFNRFSLGVQDLDRRVLDAVRRGQDLMRVEEVTEHLRSRANTSINFDLMYGLPGQDLASVTRTAREVARIRPGRIALYSYAHVPWAKPHQAALERIGLPDPDVKISLFLAMLDVLVAEGYVPIGMDHFALPTDPLAEASRKGTLTRNFMGYTTGRGRDLLGFGASAISSMGACYSQDAKDIGRYVSCVGAGNLPVERGFLLSREDEIRRDLIMELFCTFRLDMEALGTRYAVDVRSYLAGDFERLRPLEKDGLLSISPGALTVSETGRFFIRSICMAFDRYLESDASARMYSRTV